MTGSFTSALLYDRYHKRKAQRRWCEVVSHLAQEPLPATQMPRTITVFLSAPPGDGLRAAREHFHEYVKPILVAGALDWEVIEGRKEGEVRAGLAAKIRRVRRRSGEEGGNEDEAEGVEDRLDEFRRGAQIRSWDGVQGDLILGRHTWKEYIRGTHEGWLGPLNEPSSHGNTPPNEIALSTDASVQQVLPNETKDVSSDTISREPVNHDPPGEGEEPTSQASSDPSPMSEKSEEKPPPKLSPQPPYILPQDYPTSPLSNSIPSELPPSMVVPLPHLLGFRNTPIRIYRFLTRRYLTETTGQSVATLVLASHTRGFGIGKDFVSSANLEDNMSPSGQSAEVAELTTTWEQETVLSDEEGEWHKSARALNGEDNPDRERPWQEKMVIDERIGVRMRAFDLSEQERDEKLQQAEIAMLTKKGQEKGPLQKLSVWLGIQKKEGMKGWEMGMVGNEDD